MPVASHQIPNGSRVLLFTCDVCGEPACFGDHVDVRAALATGDVRKAGNWFCRDHIPARLTHTNPYMGE